LSTYTDDQRQFLAEHVWGILATGRGDGSPQQSMVGYALDDAGRILVLTQTRAAKWRNAVRQPRVSFAVPDGRVHVVVYGVAEGIDADPERAERAADVLAVVRAADRPEPSSLIEWLDADDRRVLRITPESVFSHE
jgi:PPOX class probable F420-dependent enzyme